MAAGRTNGLPKWLTLSVLTPSKPSRLHNCRMVSRTRLGRVLQNLALFAGAAAIISYFYFQTYDGNYGLNAQRTYEQEIVNLTVERDALRASRIDWEARLELLRSDRLDPDLLEEIARRDLGFVKPNDFVLLTPSR